MPDILHILLKGKANQWRLLDVLFGFQETVHAPSLFPRELKVPQGVHSSSTVIIHVRAQQGYYLEQACTKCMYGRHISIERKVDIHGAWS